MDEVKQETLDVDLYKHLLDLSSEIEGHAEAEDVEWIERCESTYFAKQTDIESRLGLAKTALKSREIAALEAEYGDLFLQKGMIQEAMKHYLRIREYSREMDDLLMMTHKAALCAFHSHNYFGVMNHVRKLETIPGVDSIDPQVSSRLRLLGSLTQVICQRFDVGAKMSTKIGVEALTSSPDIISPASFSLAIILAAVASLDRQELKSVNETPGFQPILDAAPREVRAFFAAVMSSRYGEALGLLEADIKPIAWVDSVVGPHLGILYQQIHDRCICEYASAFSLIDLGQMSQTFRLPIVELEARLAHLIQMDKLEARIDLKDHRLVVENTPAKVEAYRAAIKAATMVVRDSNLQRIRSQVLRHGLSKPSKAPKEAPSGGYDDLGGDVVDDDDDLIESSQMVETAMD